MNVLVLGGRIIGTALARELVAPFWAPASRARSATRGASKKIGRRANGSAERVPGRGIG